MAQRFAGSKTELLAHDVDAGHHLGHRVFDLHSGVDLENENSLRSRSTRNSTVPAPVVQVVPERDGGVGDALAEITRQHGGGRLLDQLLEAALGRAVPVAEVDDAAVVVAEQLHLDVPGVLDVPLDVHAPVSECSLGLAPAVPNTQRDRRAVDTDHPRPPPLPPP